MSQICHLRGKTVYALKLLFKANTKTSLLQNKKQKTSSTKKIKISYQHISSPICNKHCIYPSILFFICTTLCVCLCVNKIRTLQFLISWFWNLFLLVNFSHLSLNLWMLFSPKLLHFFKLQFQAASSKKHSLPSPQQKVWTTLNFVITSSGPFLEAHQGLPCMKVSPVLFTSPIKLGSSIGTGSLPHS